MLAPEATSQQMGGVGILEAGWAEEVISVSVSLSHLPGPADDWPTASPVALTARKWAG